MINEGDIFEFPIPDGRKALAWVVYVSKRVEHMVGFVIFGVNNTLLSPDILSTRLLKMLGPFYTNEDNLGDYYDCKFFGNVEVSATQKAVMTTQIDGGAVMVGDDYILRRGCSRLSASPPEVVRRNAGYRARNRKGVSIFGENQHNRR